MATKNTKVKVSKLEKKNAPFLSNPIGPGKLPK